QVHLLKRAREHRGEVAVALVHAHEPGRHAPRGLRRIEARPARDLAESQELPLGIHAHDVEPAAHARAEGRLCELDAGAPGDLPRERVAQLVPDPASARLAAEPCVEALQRLANALTVEIEAPRGVALALEPVAALEVLVREQRDAREPERVVLVGLPQHGGPECGRRARGPRAHFLARLDSIPSKSSAVRSIMPAGRVSLKNTLPFGPSAIAPSSFQPFN